MSFDLTNLKAFWSMNESSDGSVSVSRADSHGSNTLSDVNTTPSTTGLVYGNAANLRKASSEGFFISDNADLSFSGDNDLTVCLWVKLSTHTTTMIFVSKGDDPDESYWVFYDLAANRFVFNLYSGAGKTGGAPVEASSLGAPSDGTWYFIVAWRDSSDNKLRIQVNNGTVDVSSSDQTGGFDEAGEFDIGFTNGLGDFADAVIGPAMVWKRILTSQERTDLYNSGSGLTYAAMSAPATDPRADGLIIIRGS